VSDFYSPYEIRLTPEGINQDVAPTLIELARNLPTYESTFMAKQGIPPDRVDVEVPCERCDLDDCVIWPDSLVGRVAHLTVMHGYRMNGKQYDNQNQEVGGDAKDRSDG
jgi:hypothetical protein